MSLRPVSLAMLCLTGLLPIATRAQTLLDPELALQVFAEARALCERDGGALWARSLDGPILLVEPASRRTAANVPVRGFGHEQGVWIGVLPDSVGIANTSLRFADTTWTMLMWPLPDDPTTRTALVAHELWHRVQDDIGFPMSGDGSEHLGSRDGRFWLRLEWRALARALRTSSAAEREAAMGDALRFRAARHSIFSQAADAERVLILNEGLAEYTGWTLAGPTPVKARSLAAQRLETAESADTYVRSFAYSSGPAWGLLLDVIDPDWREWADAETDLADLAADRIGWSAETDVSVVAGRSSSAYDGVDLAAEEDRLEIQRAERRKAQRQRYVEGPVLVIAFRQMRVTFDPGTVDVLDGVGRVYGSMQIIDDWGRLDVTGGGLISFNWAEALVPAPSDPRLRPLVGDGWTLTLAEGWSLLSGKRGGDWILVPENP